MYGYCYCRQLRIQQHQQQYYHLHALQQASLSTDDRYWCCLNTKPSLILILYSYLNKWKYIQLITVKTDERASFRATTMYLCPYYWIVSPISKLSSCLLLLLNNPLSYVHACHHSTLPCSHCRSLSSLFMIHWYCFGHTRVLAIRYIWSRVLHLMPHSSLYIIKYCKKKYTLAYILPSLDFSLIIYCWMFKVYLGVLTIKVHLPIVGLFGHTFIFCFLCFYSNIVIFKT